MSEVSHDQIYQRLIAVETKVDRIDENTRDLVSAIKAMQGAIKVLDWIAAAAKPILWVGGAIVTAGAIWSSWVKK